MTVGAPDWDERPPNLGFEEAATPYVAGPQVARVLTESWVGANAFCANCGSDSLTKFPNNQRLADFFCGECDEQYELKSKKGRLHGRVANGAYGAKLDRLATDQSPNLLLLTYDADLVGVTNLLVIPKHYFTKRVIRVRKPLSPAARRAGWIGSTIMLSEIPQSGRIHIIKDRAVQPRASVLAQWRHTSFLARESLDARGWLLETMRSVEKIGKPEFGIDEVYADEPRLNRLFPGNRHVREKMRQQLQVLRDRGYLDFVARGRYRLR